jgi:hypothetical protein
MWKESGKETRESERWKKFAGLVRIDDSFPPKPRFQCGFRCSTFKLLSTNFGAGRLTARKHFFSSLLDREV